MYPVAHPHECPADAVCILGEGIVDGSVLEVDRVCLCLKGCPAEGAFCLHGFIRTHFPLPCSQRKFTEAGEEADEVVKATIGDGTTNLTKLCEAHVCAVLDIRGVQS